MDVRRVTPVLGLLVLAMLVAGGCNKPPVPTGMPPSVAMPKPAEAPATPAGEPIEVRFTYSEKACYLPVVVAVEEGFYEVEGLKIVPKIVTGGIESAEALVSGQADVGTMGDAPTVIALSRSKDTRLVLCQATGERMHRIVVRDDSGIKEPKDLEGKRIAVQMGSSTHGGLLLYCTKHGVDITKINFVSLSPKDFPEAMIAKQVDAIVGSEPWPGNVMAKCKDSHEMANLKGLGSNYPLPVIANARFLAAHPTVAAALVRGTQKAVDLIKADPAKAAAVISAKSGVPAEREHKAAGDYEFMASLDDAVITSLKMTAEFLKGQKKIEAVPDIAALVDRSGLDAVKGEAK
jgi:NitT/TauT family transport system substrate-binding protein